ncbi:hypothetical protein A8924_6032 [Saccharopolyspora erythraea NRRL 2338]|nr:hypothetical protein A8924_6032 [Saccharopolyspora erythraea NRRL 2338]
MQGQRPAPRDSSAGGVNTPRTRRLVRARRPFTGREYYPRVVSRCSARRDYRSVDRVEAPRHTVGTPGASMISAPGAPLPVPRSLSATATLPPATGRRNAIGWPTPTRACGYQCARPVWHIPARNTAQRETISITFAAGLDQRGSGWSRSATDSGGGAPLHRRNRRVRARAQRTAQPRGRRTDPRTRPAPARRRSRPVRPPCASGSTPNATSRSAASRRGRRGPCTCPPRRTATR